MKKYIVALTLLASTLMLGGVSYAVDLPSNEGIIKRINGARQSTATRVYKLVRFGANSINGTQAISAGEAVVYDTISDDGITIRRTTTSADGAFAGIAVTAILSSDATSGTTALDDWGRRNWGYVLVHGKVPANSTAGGSNNAQVGDVVITSTDAGMITTIPNRATAAAVTTNGVNGIAANGGFFYDADAQGTTVEVQIDLE